MRSEVMWLGGVVWLMALGWSGLAVGAELDREVGEVQEDEHVYAPETGSVGKLEGHRRDDPLGGRRLLWPSGQVGPEGSVRTANQALGLQRLSWGWREGGEVEVAAAWWLGDQGYLSGGFRQIVHRGEATTWVVGASGRYRRTHLEPGTADSGLGLTAVVDVAANERWSWSAGVGGHVPVHQVVEELDFEGCETRQQWARGQCGALAQERRWGPSSGMWWALHLGASVAMSDRVVLKGEAFSGVSQGDFLGLGTVLDDDWSYDQERRALTEESWQWGVGALGRMSVARGAAVRAGPVAVEPGFWISHVDGEARVLPHLRVGVSMR